jgi:hypothetical protein
MIWYDIVDDIVDDIDDIVDIVCSNILSISKKKKLI